MASFIYLLTLFYNINFNSLNLIFSYIIKPNHLITSKTYFQYLKSKLSYYHPTILLQTMWKTVNSVYKSANKNIKKLGKNLPSISTVSQNIQKIKINSLIPTINPNQQSQVQKTMKSIFNNKKLVMPINKMSSVAEMSYQTQNFDLIVDMIFEKIKVFKYEAKSAKKTLNALILLSYLIKNAPSGFVDEFRQEINIFEEHSQLTLQNTYITDDKQLQKLKPLLVQIKQRAKYIIALLTDKKKLLKQKQIAMEIKRKIIQGTNKENQMLGNQEHNDLMVNFRNQCNQQNGPNSMGEKVDSFLQHYVWKYWNRFDQKMQNITQRIIQKIDEYLDLEEPQSFSIQQIQIDSQGQRPKTQTDFQESVKIRQQKFLKQKNDLDIEVREKTEPVLNTDLI